MVCDADVISVCAMQMWSVMQMWDADVISVCAMQMRPVIQMLYDADVTSACQDPATRPQTGSTVKTFPETLANPNIWVYSGAVPKFRQFLNFCFQSAVLLPGLDMCQICILPKIDTRKGGVVNSN